MSYNTMPVLDFDQELLKQIGCDSDLGLLALSSEVEPDMSLLESAVSGLQPRHEQATAFGSNMGGDAQTAFASEIQ